MLKCQESIGTPSYLLMLAIVIYPKCRFIYPPVCWYHTEARGKTKREFHEFMVPLFLQSPIQSLSKHHSPNGSHLILHVAIFSRLVIISLICFWRYLAHPYDTSAALNPSCLSVGSSIPTQSQSVRFPFLGLAIGDSIVWDGVYYVRIAECGYEYEQTYAFLPLLPTCIYALSQTGKD